ncbi:hypothetical protein HDU82_002540 [Entophlyctis luteolus]|nr:hypothetical protein HDU82_002540 [Entophlyctis luteolus]
MRRQNPDDIPAMNADTILPPVVRMSMHSGVNKSLPSLIEESANQMSEVELGLLPTYQQQQYPYLQQHPLNTRQHLALQQQYPQQPSKRWSAASGDMSGLYSTISSSSDGYPTNAAAATATAFAVAHSSGERSMSRSLSPVPSTIIEGPPAFVTVPRNAYYGPHLPYTPYDAYSAFQPPFHPQTDISGDLSRKASNSYLADLSRRDSLRQP